MNFGELWPYGPTPGSLFKLPGDSLSRGFMTRSLLEPQLPSRSAAPITTTTTVVGLKFDRGCIIAADMLASYGSLARFRDCSRVLKVNDITLLGCSGDYADYQYLQDIIKQKIISDQCMGDGVLLKPRSMFNWVTRVMYNKRSKMDPLWNNYIVAGMQDGEPFMGGIDKIGTAYEDSVITTGLGSYLVSPLLRQAQEKGPIDEERAKALIKKCMEVLYYRDARSFWKYEVGVVSELGVRVSGPDPVSSNWGVANMITMK